MPSITIEVGHGTATGIDPSMTKQLQESVGVVYSPGDPAAHKFPGRTKFNETAVGSVPLTDVLFVDSGTPRLIAVRPTGFYVSDTDIESMVGSLLKSMNGAVTDATSLNDRAYLVTGVVDNETSPFGAVQLSGSTVVRLGLSPVVTALSAQLVAGPGTTGTYEYWTTEYDSTNLVESAYSVTTGGVGITTANQKVLCTRPTTLNGTANKWRLYRTIAGGKFPIGWLVNTSDTIGTTHTDDLADADLVLNDPYRIVTINDIPESMDGDPQPLGLSSIATFEGSLVGTTAVGGDLAFTPALEPHSWPDSYRLVFPSLYGGTSKCVRKCGDGLYVAFTHETFRVNYLPDESDSVFSTAIAIEHVANYGTSSPAGMCAFTGWGGMPVLFIASLQGPILIGGNAVDRAVRNIDWPTHVDRTLLSSCKAIDNPEKWRVEFYYRDDAADSTSWACLHFYYDQARSGREVGSLPEMMWTGPHPVPGPGCYAVANGVPVSFTAGAAVTGTVYTEDSGTVDAANLTDADGTIPFRLRTPKVYPGGIDYEARGDRLFIHKNGDGAQDYEVDFNAHRENGHTTAYPMTISGEYSGVSSNGLNASLVSFDVRIVADGITAMSPINNITVRLEDRRASLKTEVT
jgi:hypothetical protein